MKRMMIRTREIRMAISFTILNGQSLKGPRMGKAGVMELK